MAKQLQYPEPKTCIELTCAVMSLFVESISFRSWQCYHTLLRRFVPSLFKCCQSWYVDRVEHLWPLEKKTFPTATAIWDALYPCSTRPLVLRLHIYWRNGKR